MQNWITTKIELDVDKQELTNFLFKIVNVNSQGDILDETEFDPESNIICKRVYRYFETDVVKEYIEYDAFDELLERHTFHKNDDGEIVKEECELLGGQKTVKEFTFTDLGNADKAEIRDESGKITGYEVYVLNEEGFVIQEIEMDADNKETSRFDKTYDEKGLLNNEKHYVDGQLFSTETFSYDENDVIQKKVQQNYFDDYESIERFKYDINGNEIYNSTHQNNVLVFEIKALYNAKNELIREEYFELDFLGRRILRHERLVHELKEY